MSPGRAGAPSGVEEEAVHFGSGGERLFGILSHPAAEPRGVAVVFLQGAGYVPSFNHNRLWVTLSRRLGTEGFHAFRFDYRGVGESTGTAARVRLDRPVPDDLLAAVGCVRRVGVERFVLVGSCFGALTALAASATPGVVSEVLLAPPVLLPRRDRGRRAAPRLRPRSTPGSSRACATPSAGCRCCCCTVGTIPTTPTSARPVRSTRCSAPARAFAWRWSRGRSGDSPRWRRSVPSPSWSAAGYRLARPALGPDAGGRRSLPGEGGRGRHGVRIVNVG